MKALHGVVGEHGKQNGAAPARVFFSVAFAGALLLAVLALPLGLRGQTEAAPAASTGWVCGVVVDETQGLVAAAELTLYPMPAAGSVETEPVARAATEPHGAFCLRDLAPGFYELRVAKPPWPIQPPRTVEVRSGLLNRLTSIELELEPGEPRVAFAESLDGLPADQARAVLERLLAQKDSASIREAARRLLPKRGVHCDIGRWALGFDPKPLVDELLRQMESGYLPPLKTARYLFAVGQLVDPRTRDNVMRLLLAKLRDARRLPPDPTRGEATQNLYVSDVAIQGVAHITGKDFKWKYGQPPLQNQSAIASAQTWWKQEVERRERDRR